MQIAISHNLPRNRALAGSTVAFSARFYNDSNVLTAPTSIRYRLYDTEACTDLVAWTTVSPATTATISIPGTATESECRKCVALILEGNEGLATQAQARKLFTIDPLPSQA